MYPMKKFVSGLIALFCVLSPALIKAQTFTTITDTVRFTIVTGVEQVHNDITIPGASPLTVSWHVASTNFPSDWLSSSALGICDGNTCRNNTGDVLLWNRAASVPGSTFNCTYPSGPGGTFEYSPNLTSTTTNGCYYLTVYMTDGLPLGTSKQLTFIICKGTLNSPSLSSLNNKDEATLYPNPANSEVNVVYDADADVKSVAIYNIIGKMMNVYKVAGNSANLNIENVPSGIYFLKLYNSKGNVVVTRKFTKQ